jgi:hypothetical protein
MHVGQNVSMPEAKRRSEFTVGKKTSTELQTSTVHVVSKGHQFGGEARRGARRVGRGRRGRGVLPAEEGATLAVLPLVLESNPINHPMKTKSAVQLCEMRSLRRRRGLLRANESTQGLPCNSKRDMLMQGVGELRSRVARPPCAFHMFRTFFHHHSSSSCVQTVCTLCVYDKSQKAVVRSIYVTRTGFTSVCV